MQENLNRALNELSSICTSCGKEFEQPLLASLHSDSGVEEYYACPKCLSKVREIELEKEPDAADSKEELPVEEPPKVEPSETQENSGCPYHVGYLKKRQKGTSIPEGCLTCMRIIECM